MSFTVHNWKNEPVRWYEDKRRTISEAMKLHRESGGKRHYVRDDKTGKLVYQSRKK